jgi:hypothetical protein
MYIDHWKGGWVRVRTCASDEMTDGILTKFQYRRFRKIDILPVWGLILRLEQFPGARFSFVVLAHVI